jgi:hypothetical protein
MSRIKINTNNAGGQNMEAVEFGTSAVSGVIEIPAEYRKDFSTGLRVILIKEAENSAAFSPSMAGRHASVHGGRDSPEIHERLAAAERLAGFASKHPLSREEIRDKRLARQ